MFIIITQNLNPQYRRSCNNGYVNILYPRRLIENNKTPLELFILIASFVLKLIFLPSRQYLFKRPICHVVKTHIFKPLTVLRVVLMSSSKAGDFDISYRY